MTRRVRSLSAAMVVLAALAVGVAIGAVAARSGDEKHAAPANDSADAGFVRDMSTHHAQAVSMADAIRTRTDDPLLASLATDIVLTQQSQIGRFSGWLDQWGLPVTSTDAPMSWASGHTAMDMEMMPGMATNDEIRQLDSLPIEDAEILFLTLMIRHHRGGVEMADTVLTMTQRDEVRRIASSIVASQQSEIEAMQSMLDERTTS
jgi:uncharacterized protein (DUF305 family)